ncbi:hypothetical protein [Clostridium coskatii]|uniref:Uncharacterized protein n=1 Tax=Clostridium coskatii TaxID=1705578 RepID=A0A166TLU1_9CLOT|nr:hypothetical protein [Clostridium coskatii]OAA93849.1 hypothetical protein WX73_03759 [Clostridium coskatii]OBR95177.1 hypothetical protein CLCOS_15010 [Clostridium coskatii]
MKKKKIIIAVIVVCAAILSMAAFGIRNRSLESTADVQNNVLSSKSKHNTALEKSNDDKSCKYKDESTDKCKMEAGNKSKSSTSPAAQTQLQSKTNSSNTSASQTQTFTGYITTEDDFAAGLHEDTADMVYMKLMAEAGLGITFQQAGKWVFYYFDGTIATKNTSGADGKWAFDGTGSQLNAWNIVGGQVKAGKGKSPVPVTVKGVLKGNTEVNPGPDTDGKSFQVITVESINGN